MTNSLAKPEFILFRTDTTIRIGLSTDLPITMYGRRFAFVGNGEPKELANLKAALDGVGVLYSVQEVKAFSPTCSGEMVLSIGGDSVIAKFHENGGIAVTDGAFKDKNFDKKVGMDEISIKADDEIKASMTKHHIPVTEEDDVIKIIGKTALAAVAMGDGKFTNAAEYLALAGFELAK